jgi:hypothetical protein
MAYSCGLDTPAPEPSDEPASEVDGPDLMHSVSGVGPEMVTQRHEDV